MPEVGEGDVEEAARLLEQMQDMMRLEGGGECGEDEEEDEAAQVERILREALEAPPAPAPLAAVPAGAAPTFPSAPTQAAPRKQPLAARLPAVPTFKPGAGPPPLAFKPKAPVAAEEEDTSRWCCICTNDADVYCHGCDDDPYCRRCWHEGHQDEDLRQHRTVPLRGPKKVERLDSI